MNSNNQGGGILRKGKYSKYNPDEQIQAPEERTEQLNIDTAVKQKSGMISIADLLKQQSNPVQPQ